MCNQAKGLLAFSAVLVAIMLAGINDYHDAVEQEKHYCSMVKDGHWPNYKNQECEE